ncbi:hypothetical protein DVH05_008399 [Phytophthora capsici]|nr:hypothetical protein DVH05_008399 [Phytophthora capsici]
MLPPAKVGTTVQISTKNVVPPSRGKAPVYRSIGPPRPYDLDPFLMLDEFNVGLSDSFQDHIMFVPPASKTTCAM